MISPRERNMIRALAQDPRWEAVQSLAQGLEIQFRQEGASKDTQWETVRSMLMAEGRVDGLRRFIREIDAQASNDKD